MMILKKNNKAVELVSLHCDEVFYCYTRYVEIMKAILETENQKAVNDYTDEINTIESRADDIRREIIRNLFHGRLLLDSRKSIMTLIEGADQVADIVQDIVFQICFENINNIDLIKEEIFKINELTKEQLGILVEVIKEILDQYKIEDIHNKILQIEKLESKVDVIEKEVIKKIFATECELAQKLHYKDFISKIARVSDVIEDISDTAQIVIMARTI